MDTGAIERVFNEKVAAEVHLAAEGNERYHVFTPFQFDDGDHLVIVLKRGKSGWMLSDEGHTYMRLTYDVDEADLLRGTSWQIISGALSMFEVEDRNGELVIGIEDEQYGDALFSFVQALLKIADVSYLSRECVRSTFQDDFRGLLAEIVPDERRIFDWHDHQRDPQGNYTVDCRINGMSHPLYVYALSSDTNTRDATIALRQFREWDIDFHPVGIFEDRNTIARRVLARFGDVCATQFASLSESKGSIASYLTESIKQND